MANTDQTAWQKWNSELEMARKVRGYKSWCDQGKKIVKRYRDQRTDSPESTDTARSAETARFNILWSNIQTLMPAVFAKQPKPVVERRYLDRDEVGRTASVILERALLYELDGGTYFDAVRRAVLDRLLPGRGIVWVRYEPTFRNVPAKTQETTGENDADGNDDSDGGDSGGDHSADAGVGGGADEVATAPPAPPEQEKIYECVAVDYLDWQDFLCSPSRTWEEVWWNAKRVYLTDDDGKARFLKTWKDIKLDWVPEEQASPSTGASDVRSGKKAKVWEIWNKRDRKVIWITESEGTVLDEVDDPLKLEGFWPCPKPISATMTNETMVPVPDYHEYQDQAVELDDLTGRIQALTKAIKIAGVYDASVPALQRILQEGMENELIGVDNMAEFSQKAGPDGMGHIWLLPIKEMAEVLIQLYQAREATKQTLYEITGISDIVRGQAGEGAAKTATEQRIKGQFASLRLSDIKSDTARFARDVLSIMGEVIAEHYSDETLYLVSAYEQYAREQFLGSPGGPPPVPAGQPPPMGHNGGPPMQAAPPGAQGPQPQAMPPASPMAVNGAGGGGPVTPPAAPQPSMNGAALPGMAGMMGQPAPPSPAQQAAEMFAKAVALLRSDKLRGFRIDIETDSIIEPDEQATQQARTELLGAISQFLPQAMMAGASDPKLKPLLGQLLLYFLRGFKAGRDLEGMFEQFIDDMVKEAKNPQPKPPSPEQIKAQAEMQKQQMESQRQQQEMANDHQRMQAEMAMKQQEAQLKEREMMMEFEHQQRMIQLKEREARIGLQVKVQGAQIDAQSQQQQAEIDAETQQREAAAGEHKAELDREATDHKHEVGLEMMDQKRKDAAAKPKAGASK